MPSNIKLDIQKLEPGEVVNLFELDLTSIGGPTQRFHGYSVSGIIYWQGNSFYPWPIEANGFGRTSDAKQPQPTLSVGNIGMDEAGEPIPGMITSLCLQYDDLVGGKLLRYQTLSKYLDAENFPDGNPEADPNEFLPTEIWIVEQKTNETADIVEFSLSSPLDFSGKMLPKLQIIANICPWLWEGGYRGPYCNYVGTAMFDIDGNPTIDATLDKCGGRVSDCKKRFAAEQGVSEDAAVLNFGGFPSVDRLGTGSG